jgi:superfamily II RNA helicase
LDKAVQFAEWVETTKRLQGADKTLYLMPTSHRVVPLTHSLWLCANESTIKRASKPQQQEFAALAFKPQPIYSSDQPWQLDERVYTRVRNLAEWLIDVRAKAKPQFVLNALVGHLKSQNLLPAICFVFSRKQVMQLAHQITQGLFEENSELPRLVPKECAYLLRSKLPNVDEYMALPEYVEVVGLLEKGIGVHHAGMMPVLREIVELMFEKGYVKLLFATETFAVGLNLPTKTVIFTDVEKFTNGGKRPLYPHEYTQMAGRAGRRGLDTIGHVIHAVNLYDMLPLMDIKKMLQGLPQKLTSKFTLSYNLLLTTIQATAQEGIDMVAKICQFVGTSLRGLEHAQLIESLTHDLVEDQARLKAYCPTWTTNTSVLAEYVALEQQCSKLVNAALRQTRRQLNLLEDNHPSLRKDLLVYRKWLELNRHVSSKEQELVQLQSALPQLVTILLDKLIQTGYVKHDERKRQWSLTKMGELAIAIQEAHPLALSNEFMALETTTAANDLAALLALFNACRSIEPRLKPDQRLSQAVQEHSVQVMAQVNKWNEWELRELQEGTGAACDINYDIQWYVHEWCKAANEQDCKTILALLEQDEGIPLGDFIKALLKLNTMANEMAQVTESLEMKANLLEIPKLTLKYVATNQSLYV